MTRTDVRLALPSKGRLQEATMRFLAQCGFEIRISATRSYTATIPALPDVTVVFQRPRDITISVANGGVDFGITGLDVVHEAGVAGKVSIIHDALGYGKCKLVVAVPDAWTDVRDIDHLRARAVAAEAPVRVATVFPHLTRKFLDLTQIRHEIVEAEGSLEVMPEIGSADIICDLVETGNTLIQNRLRMITGGTVIETQSVLLANRANLARPEAMQIAVLLIEAIEAHLRAQGRLMIWANVRGDSFEDVGKTMALRTSLGGLQGPTISPIYPNSHTELGNPSVNWYSVSIAVNRSELQDAINQLRGIGASGVVVTPITYIFEEQPSRVLALKQQFPAAQ